MRGGLGLGGCGLFLGRLLVGRLRGLGWGLGIGIGVERSCRLGAWVLRKTRWLRVLGLDDPSGWPMGSLLGCWRACNLIGGRWMIDHRSLESP